MVIEREFQHGSLILRIRVTIIGDASPNQIRRLLQEGAERIDQQFAQYLNSLPKDQPPHGGAGSSD